MSAGTVSVVPDAGAAVVCSDVGASSTSTLRLSPILVITLKSIAAIATIAAIITNARLDKAQMNKVAAMASNGIARTIRPVNTSMDGDTVYALTTGKVQASEDAVGTLASYVLAKAIVKAVKETDSLYGYRSAKDLMKE